MFQKLNNQFQKGLGQAQQAQQPQASQPEVVTFSLARMDEFSHEELQQVIVRYDGQVKKLKAISSEKDTKIKQLEAKVEQVVIEQKSIEEMLDLRNGEINGLKQHVQTFMTENESLKRLVSALEQSSQQVEDLETENQQLKLQLEDLKNLNASLSTGDVEQVYQTKLQQIQQENERLVKECSNIKQSLQHSNEQLSQLAHESEELESSLQNAEKSIQKKDKLIEQLKQRQCQFLDEKQIADDKIAELTEFLKKSEQMTKQIGKSNDTFVTEYAERIRGKELVIQDLNSQIRQLTGKVTSFGEKEVYYKRQIESLQRTVYELQQEKQALTTTKNQSDRVMYENQSEKQNEGISELMNRLLEIQGSPVQTQTQGDVSSSVKVEPLSESKDNLNNQETLQLKQEISELHQKYQELVINYQQVTTQLSESETKNQELEQKLNTQIEIVQELERRRSMARKEVKQLLLKTPKVGDQIQQAGILQLRVLKKDLQQLYKDLLTTGDKTVLEKSVNDMIFNVNDCIQEAELATSN